jgi:membrane protein implicated in regulation of membrane protease activity
MDGWAVLLILWPLLAVLLVWLAHRARTNLRRRRERPPSG